MSDAIRTLEVMFAKGEITEAEFNSRRAILNQSSGGSQAVAEAAKSDAWGWEHYLGVFILLCTVGWVIQEAGQGRLVEATGRAVLVLGGMMLIGWFIESLFDSAKSRK